MCKTEKVFGFIEPNTIHHYVVDGAELKCSMGTENSFLDIPDHQIDIGFGRQVLDYDTKSKYFIVPFGTCLKTLLPCTLDCLAPKWDNPDSTVGYFNVTDDNMTEEESAFWYNFSEKNDADFPIPDFEKPPSESDPTIVQHPITIYSTLKCLKGGTISIVDNGQETDSFFKTASNLEVDRGHLMIVYLLFFYYNYGEKSKHEWGIDLGCYKTEKDAKEAKERYKRKKGFALFSETSFDIWQYILDMDTDWLRGFSEENEDTIDYLEKSKDFVQWVRWASTDTLEPEKIDRVYLLSHEITYGQSDEHTETRLISVYSTKEYAENAIERYFTYQGFNRYSKSCFKITKFVLNKDMYYENGFSPTHSPTT